MVPKIELNAVLARSMAAALSSVPSPRLLTLVVNRSTIPPPTWLVSKLGPHRAQRSWAKTLPSTAPISRAKNIAQRCTGPLNGCRAEQRCISASADANDRRPLLLLIRLLGTACQRWRGSAFTTTRTLPQCREHWVVCWHTPSH